MTSFGHTRKRARQNHVCGFCGEVIPKGSAYMRWVERVEGVTRTRKAHLGCEAVSLLALGGSRDLQDVLGVLALMSWEEVEGALLLERDLSEEWFRVEGFWREARVKRGMLPCSPPEGVVFRGYRRIHGIARALFRLLPL